MLFSSIISAVVAGGIIAADARAAPHREETDIEAQNVTTQDLGGIMLYNNCDTTSMPLPHVRISKSDERHATKNFGLSRLCMG